MTASRRSTRGASWYVSKLRPFSSSPFHHILPAFQHQILSAMLHFTSLKFVLESLSLFLYSC